MEKNHGKQKWMGSSYRKSPSTQQATATSRRNGLTSIAARPRRPRTAVMKIDNKNDPSVDVNSLFSLFHSPIRTTSINQISSLICWLSDSPSHTWPSYVCRRHAQNWQVRLSDGWWVRDFFRETAAVILFPFWEEFKRKRNQGIRASCWRRYRTKLYKREKHIHKNGQETLPLVWRYLKTTHKERKKQNKTTAQLFVCVCDWIARATLTTTGCV
jgi:hypothetical protein